jgi:hypothetical protein
MKGWPKKLFLLRRRFKNIGGFDLELKKTSKFFYSGPLHPEVYHAKRTSLKT